MKSSIHQAFKEDRWIIPYLKTYWKTLLAAVVLGVIASVFAAALMFTSGYMISLAATIPFTVLALHISSLFVRIFGIGKPIIQYFERLSNHNWVLKMTSNLRVKLYKVLERNATSVPERDVLQPDAPRTKKRLGDFLGLLSEDIEHVQDLFLRTIFPLIVTLLLTVIAVIALGVFSWQMGLLLLIIAAQIVIVLPLVSIAKNGAHLMRVHKLTNEVNVEFTDAVVTISDWRLSGRKSDLEHSIQNLFTKIHTEEHAVRSHMRRVRIISQVLTAVFVCLLLAWCAFAFAPFAQEGASFAFATDAALMLGGVTPHDSSPYAANWIAAFILCVFPLFEVFAQAPDASLGFVRQEESVSELNTLGNPDDNYKSTRKREDGIQVADLREPDNKAAAFAMRGSKECDINDADKAVICSHACFLYGTKPVLNDVTFEINKGENVAIMGRSGEGKSTLIKLICGDYGLAEGQIQTDGKICFIEQNPYIFRKSLRENLLLAKPSASDAEIMEALDRAGLSQFVSHLPKGLDTILVESGLSVSGGERQRIAVARALLTDASIIILDEPFRGLDIKTEDELQKTLFEVFADKTIIVVTHHLLGIERFERVLFLQNGRISMDGAPVQLARENDTFRRLLAFDTEDIFHTSKV